MDQDNFLNFIRANDMPIILELLKKKRAIVHSSHFSKVEI